MERIASLFLLCLAGNMYAGGIKVDKRPNILLFLVDDMGWQDTSVPFWNQKTPFNERYETPNMERLARKGMKFTQAYANSISSPSRVSLFTGMNSTSTKSPIGPWREMLPMMLQVTNSSIHNGM